MKAVVRIVMIIAAALAATACQKSAEEAPDATEQAAAAPVVVIPLPTDRDREAWKPYLTQMVRPYIDRRYRRPFMYFIPDVDPTAEDVIDQQRQYDDQLSNVQNTIGRGVQSGSLLAFGGPNSQRVGDVIVAAFAFAGPKSLKGVRVVVIAQSAERERIEAAIASAQPEFIWVEME